MNFKNKKVKNLQMFTRTFQNPNVTLEYLLFQRKVIIKCVIITGNFKII